MFILSIFALAKDKVPPCGASVLSAVVIHFQCHRLTRRPEWKQQSDIGSWITVLNVLGFFAIIVNSTMISFVGMRYAENSTERLGGFAMRTENWRLWGHAVLIEHGMLLLRVLILLLFPAVPTWLEGAKEALHFKCKNLSDLSDYAEEEVCSPPIEGEQKTQQHITKKRIRGSLASTDTDGLLLNQALRLEFLKRYEVLTVDDTMNDALTRTPLANVDDPKAPIVPGMGKKKGKKKGKKEAVFSPASNKVSVKVRNPMAADDDIDGQD